MGNSLRAYIITRALLTIPMILILLTLVFLVLRVMPGDPAAAMLGAQAPPETVARVREQLGLNDPLPLQYWHYLSRLVRGDFGTSMVQARRPIATEIKEKFPATLELTVFAMTLIILIGVFSGAFAAHRRRSTADYSLRLFGITAYSIPIFWLGMLLQLLFGVYLKLLPVYGRIGVGMRPERMTGLFVVDSILTRNWASLQSALVHLVLPSVTLAVVLSGIFIRLTRANMLDVLHQDFITAARARGLSERKVVYQHALKNAFIPILTMMGLQFALLLAGAVLTETTFSWPGMGRYLVERIGLRDFPAIQGSVVFFAFLVAAISLVVDVIYAYLDPRIRY